MQFSVITSAAVQARVDCLALGAGASAKRARLSAAAAAVDEASGGQLAKLARAAGFTGKRGSILMLNSIAGVSAARVLLIGFGQEDELTPVRYRSAVNAAMKALGSSGAGSAASYLHEVDVPDRDLEWKTRQSVESALLEVYRFNECKSSASKTPDSAFTQLRLAAGSRAEQSALKRAVDAGHAIGAGINLARDLGNLPANICTPTYLGRRAQALARNSPALRVKVLGPAEINRLKMGSFLGVASGSREPPRLIVFEYNGAGKGEKPVALVGKGVTFDTGGISLKPSATMDEMKFDMCGAASVFGTMHAISTMQLPLNVVGIVPATENMPDGKATKPGDIHTTMSGQTVEILNTDAEGRLVLCDALTYVKRFKPRAVIDIATLTGACVVALGKHASGLWSNHQPLADALIAAGQDSGDRAWQMPLWPDYDEALKSNFADVANVGGRDGGAITAASFLARFARDLSWAHLDIAGTAWLGGGAKGSTGRPVGLLTQYLVNVAGAAKR